MCKSFFALALLSAPVLAHDACRQSDWIGERHITDTAGTWCCGAGDCAILDKGAVNFTPRGYAIHGMGTYCGSSEVGDIRERFDEEIPANEALPVSQDGQYWRCHNSSALGMKARRCFIVPAQAE